MNKNADIVISAKDLVKKYGRNPAIDSISFHLKKGEKLVVLGPNGSGKSTLFGILSTVLPYDSGRVEIAGMELKKNRLKIRKKIGVVFQNNVLDEHLTVKENLQIRGGLYGVTSKQLKTRIFDISEMTGITDLMEEYYGKLSGGQKRRCDIARSLVHYPQILILDEPTAGIDLEIRSSILDTVEIVKRTTGMTVLMITHHMDEAAGADKLIMMKKGKIIFDGSMKDIEKNAEDTELILYTGEKRKKFKISESKTALNILRDLEGRYETFEVIKKGVEGAYASIIKESDIKEQ